MNVQTKEHTIEVKKQNFFRFDRLSIGCLFPEREDFCFLLKCKKTWKNKRTTFWYLSNIGKHISDYQKTFGFVHPNLPWKKQSGLK